MYQVLLLSCICTVSLVASAPAPAPACAPASFNGGYDPSAPSWNVAWTDAEKQVQRQLGLQLVQNITTSLQLGAIGYRITPGTYRISTPIPIMQTTNFTLEGQGSEIIAEDLSIHFSLMNNTNLTILGPLTLDADDFGFSEGRILGTDNASFIEVQLFEGYTVPEPGGRIMFFSPVGDLFRGYQVGVTTVTPSTTNPGVYALGISDVFWTAYNESRYESIATGNLVSIEKPETNGGLYLVGNHGTNLTRLSIHSYSLIFGQRETGPVVIDQLRGVRRPGTSRLTGGGFVALSMRGGSITLTNSEISYNFDDLTDLQSGIAYAFAQASPTVVYAGFSYPPDLGTTLRFYDVATLEFNGAANITGVQEVTNPQIAFNFQAGLTQLQLNNFSVVPVLLTLDSPVNLTNVYAIIESWQTRMEFILVENCYMHDSLAAGINAKGAARILIRNNTVRRSGYRGTSVGFDPFWWEGDIPSNILIEDNLVEDVPHSLQLKGQAISTYVDSSPLLLQKATGSPIHNVTIRRNTVVNPKVGGIGISFAANATVTNNTIINPVAFKVDTAEYLGATPFAKASAIFLDSVSGTVTVSNNRILDVDPTFVPKSILFGANSSTPADLVICSNSESIGGGPEVAMPDQLWTTVLQSSPLVSSLPPFLLTAYTADDGRTNFTYTLPFTLQSAVSSFSFIGTRVQWLGCRGPTYGLAQVQLDNASAITVDASMPPPGIIPNPGVGLCNLALYDSGPLPLSKHTIVVTNLAKAGMASASQFSTAMAVLGFSYLTGGSTCTSGPSQGPSGAVTQPASAPVPAASLVGPVGGSQLPPEAAASFTYPRGSGSAPGVLPFVFTSSASPSPGPSPDP